MLHNDDRFHEAVEKAVQDAEARTDAEIVVVAASRSGHYRDLAVLAGGAFAWLTLGFFLWSPFSFSAWTIPLELLVAFGLATWLVNRSPAVLSVLASRKRKARQVGDSAAATFHQEAVHGTRGRTGVLVYVSALEDQVVVIPDVGLAARVPSGELNSVRWGAKTDPNAPGDLDHFVGGLRLLGEVLGNRIPAQKGDNPDEMSNAPRVRA